MPDASSDETTAGTMVLAVDLSAVTRFKNPQTVFAEAREWSRFVGVVAEAPDDARSYVDRHGIQQDFELGAYDRRTVLSGLADDIDADRYVYVGVTDADRRLADAVGWEFVEYREVADKAGWAYGTTETSDESDLSSTDDERERTGDTESEATGVLGRIRNRLFA
ncbi:hypothetical protein ACLI4Z_18730 [Natrialbaceae archaeon A-arb3/5]